MPTQLTGRTASRLHTAATMADPVAATPAEAAMNLDTAYAVQRELAQLSGQRIAGYKIGLTSAAAQAQFSVDHPIAGFLTDTAVIASHDTVSLTGMIDPKVEIEFGFLLAEDVDGSATAADILAATRTLMLCLEIIDSRWSGGPGTVAMLVADNSSAARAVTVREIGVPDGLADAAVSATIGNTVLSGNARDVMGHPAQSVAWLAGHLATDGRRLAAGDLVLSGSLIAPQPIRPGDQVDADFGPLGTVSVRFG